MSKEGSRRVVLSVLLSVVAFGLGTGFAPAVTATTTAGPTIIPMVHMDVSEPLATERPGVDRHNHDAKPHRPVPEGRSVQLSSDSVSPPAVITPRIPSTSTNFDGVGNGFNATSISTIAHGVVAGRSDLLRPSPSQPWMSPHVARSSY